MADQSTTESSSAEPPESEPVPVTVTGCDTSQIQGDQVVMNNSAARSIDAREVRLDHSAAAVIEGNDVTLSNSVCLQVHGERVAVFNSPTWLVATEHARVEDSPVFLFLGRVDAGRITTLFDWRGALALGLGAGLTMALAGALIRRR